MSSKSLLIAIASLQFSRMDKAGNSNRISEIWERGQTGTVTIFPPNDAGNPGIPE
jgi:hypothetical protein